MQQVISSRHLDLARETRDSLEARLATLGDRWHKLTSARLVLDFDAPWYDAEIILHGKQLEIEAKARANDLLPAFAAAFEKAEKQLDRHLDRIKDHHHQAVKDLEQEQRELELAALEAEAGE